MASPPIAALDLSGDENKTHRKRINIVAHPVNSDEKENTLLCLTELAITPSPVHDGRTRPPAAAEPRPSKPR